MMMGREEVVKADLIAQTALQHFSSLGKSPLTSFSSSSAPPEFTVIASFVVESEDKKAFYPLCTASGTKCLGAKEVAEAMPGTVLKDSHAEILARRAFNRFLLNLIKRREESSSTTLSLEASKEDTMLNELLIPVENDSKDNVGRSMTASDTTTTTAAASYRWNSEWKLHLYISDSPCGDASIYERRGRWKELGRELNAEPINKSYTGANNMNFNFTGAKLLSVAKEGHEQRIGCMRLKSGRSDIPDRCRTTCYSCSDKIAKWAVVGVQSALVSTLIEPIYLNSIVVSSDPLSSREAQFEALHRAILSRTEQARSLAQLNVTNTCAVLISSCVYVFSKSAMDSKMDQALDGNDGTQAKKQRTDSVDGNICTGSGNMKLEKKNMQRKGLKPRPAGSSLNWILNECGENEDCRIELTQALSGLRMGITAKTINEMKKAMQDLSTSSSCTFPDKLYKIVSRLSPVSFASLYEKVLKIVNTRGNKDGDDEGSNTDNNNPGETTMMEKYSKWKALAVVQNNLKDIFLSSEKFKQWRGGA